MENIKDRIEQLEGEVSANEEIIARIKEKNSGLNKSIKKLKKVEEQINEIFNESVSTDACEPNNELEEAV